MKPLRLGTKGQAFVLAIEDSTALETLLQRWSSVPGVAYVQPNRTYRVDRSVASETPLDSLAHLRAIGIPDAWRATQGRAEVRIGVVDTGLWFDHPALAGQVAINTAEDLNGNGRLDAGDFNGIDDDGNGYIDDVSGYDFVDRGLVLFPGDYRLRDPDPAEDPVAGAGRGHGTAVAGAIAARYLEPAGTSGVAPGSRLVPLRAFGADGIGEDDDIATAIVYAAEMGLDVLNLSFGDVYRSPVMHDAIAYAVSRGVVVVASGGNDGMAAPHYPSDYPEVISVAWLTQDGQQRSGRASRGVGIDLGAPGSQIYTTIYRPTEGEGRLYGRESGSSVAAPLVSGTVALLRSIDPSLSPASIRSILTATAQDIEQAGWDETTGAGLLRADRALLLALPARLEWVSLISDGGSPGPVVPLIATALDPAFATLHVEVAPGYTEPFSWQAVASPRSIPALRDTVAFWNTGSVAEGPYTLRLRLERTDGAVIESRARTTIDRSAPVFAVRDVRVGLVDGAYAIVADVETDDVTTVVMFVGDDAVRSDRVARRHGLVWEPADRAGGAVSVRVEAVNVAGIRSAFSVAVPVPAWRPDPAGFSLTPLDVPAGYLLPEATDFDGDGSPEIVLNQAPDGALGDTLSVWEATPAGFARRMALIATVIPRSAGDTDGDGRGELLGQVQAAALLLEAASPGGFPTELAFADTVGLRDVTSRDALYGAVLADLDGDGLGEIIGHNGRQIRVLERRGSAFTEVARLGNPTAQDSVFSEPDFRVADLNRNGRPELIAPDADGDVLAYEAAGDDRYEIAWQIDVTGESLRSTVAVGDVDGDGHPELLTFSQNQTGTRTDREQEPAVATFRLWRFPDGAPDSLSTLTFYGAGYPFAGATMADMDGDGRAEVVIAYPPGLYVLSWTGTDLVLRFHSGDDGSPQPTVVRSPSLAAADFDRDGAAEVIAAFTDGRLHRLRFASEMQPVAPRWEAAFARNDSTVVLRWSAAGDSVEVFAGTEAGDLATLATARADSLVIMRRAPAVYGLRAWVQGRASELSDLRHVIPRPAGIVTTLIRPSPEVVEIETDRALAEPSVDAVRVGGHVPVSALLVSPRVARFRFAEVLAASDTLFIHALRDTSGAPIQSSRWPVPPVAAQARGLFIVGAEVTGATTVRLRFSEPLDAATIRADAFTITPAGTVADAVVEGDDASVVLLDVTGVALGPTGLSLAVRATGLRSADGQPLEAEGSSVLLAEAAADLTGAFVFPNPARVGTHDAITFGGVPALVEAVVVTVDGSVVRRIATEASRGGLRWDLRDEAGTVVPSGVYLVRLTARGSTPVLLKAAIIR